MKARANVRCPACRWSTSRAPKGNQMYGQCPRCWATLVQVQARPFFTRAKTPLPDRPRRYHEQYATWPELVAAELDRREREPAR